MTSLRKWLLLILVLALTAAAAPAFAQDDDGEALPDDVLIVQPEAGPIGTSHDIFAINLEANTAYTLEVIFEGSSEVVYSGTVMSDDMGGLATALFSEPTDPFGVYTIRLIDADGETQREGTLTITEGERVVGQVTGDIVASEPISTALTNEVPEDRYTYAAREGEVVSIRMESPDFDAYLLLFDGATGEVLAQNDDGAGGTDAAINAFTFPAEGTYIIAATSRQFASSGGMTPASGDYTLSVVPARFADPGPVFPGELVIGELTAERQIAEYSFDAAAGDLLTVALGSEDFDPLLVLLGPDGEQIAVDDDSGPGLFARLDSFALEADGTYTLRVDGYRGQTGERQLEGRFTLSLDIPGAPPPPVPTMDAMSDDPSSADAASDDTPPAEAVDLIYGQTLPAELSVGSRDLRFTFQGGPGDVVQIRVTSDDFDPNLALLDPDGTEIASDDDGGVGVNALLDDFTLTRSGVFTIVVDGYRGVNNDREIGGRFVLRLRLVDVVAVVDETPPADEEPADEEPSDEELADETPVSIEPTPLIFGEGAEGTLGAGQAGIPFSFEAAAGDVVNVIATSDDFDVNLTVLDPDGAELAFDDDGGIGLNAALDALELPVDGVYTVLVDGYRGVDGDREISGRFTLLLERADAPEITEDDADDAADEDSAAPPVPVESSELAYGDVVAGVIEAGQADIPFSFEASAGDVVDISLASGDFDPLLRLLDPDGAELITDDDGGEGLNAFIEGLTLPDSGTYTILVDGYRGVNADRDIAGDFTLSLVLVDTAAVTEDDAPPADDEPAMPDDDMMPDDAEVVEGGSIAYNQSLSGELPIDAAAVAYVFEGAAGDEVTITLQSEAFDPLLGLFGPDDALLARDDDSGPDVQALIEGFVLPADGAYVIVVNAFRGFDNDLEASGEFTLTLTLGDADVVTVPDMDADDEDQADDEDIADEDTAADEEVPMDEDTAADDADAPVIVAGTTLAYGQAGTFSFNGVPDESAAFNFLGEGGDMVTIAVDSSGSIDTELVLIDPDGETLEYDDDSGPGSDPELRQIILPAFGGYTIQVTPFLPLDAGEVTVTLTLDSALTVDGPAVSVTLNEKTPVQTLSFNAEAGQTLRLTLESASLVEGEPVVFVFQSEEELAFVRVGRAERQSIEFTPQTDAPVRVVIEIGEDGGFGALDVSINSVDD